MDFLAKIDPQTRRTCDLLFSVAGIYSCYLYYGVIQNELYVEQSDKTRFGFTAFVLLVQCLLNAAIATGSDFVGKLMPKSKAEGEGGAGGGGSGGGGGSEEQHQIQSSIASSSFWTRLRAYNVATASLVYIGAMYTSNASLNYNVSYAFQALAKSCKPIPVLLASILITGKKYTLLKLTCVLGMVAGVLAFQFAKESGGSSSKGGHHGDAGASSSDSSEGQYIGLFMLAISLLFDGINGPLQEQLKKSMTEPEQGMAVNMWASLYMLLAALATDQFFPALSYLSKHTDLWYKLVLFGVCSGVGQLFIFHTIRSFDALTLSIITTTRKFATIGVNAILLPAHNKLNLMQWACVAFVFVCVSIDSVVEGLRKSPSSVKGGKGGPGGGVGGGESSGSSSHTRKREKR